MKVEDVRIRVEQIRKDSFDDEGAHCDEDALWADVLKAIAANAENPSALAAEALKTKQIEFSRWYA